MSDEKTKLVPKLRFPEFRGAQGWERAFLGDLSEVVRGGSPRPIDGFLTTAADGLNWLKIGDVDKEAKYVTHTQEKVRPEALSKTRVVSPGDLILSNSMSFGRPYILQIKTCIHDGWIAITRIAKEAERDFLYYSISAPTSQSYFVDNAAGSGVQNLNADIIKTLSVCFPSLTEQQKIADCLSSLDELIAAQARKVEALKTHKKGLMQQLFPREGESQPRLRFPEFQNAGKWEVRTIGDMFRLINGCAFKPEDWKPTGTPIIRIQNLNDPSAEFNYSQEPVPERNRVESGDLLFAWSGTLGSSFGARIWNGPSGVLNQHIFKVLMDEQQITLQFALLVLARVEEEIARRTHGFKASFVHVKKADLVQVEMLLPSVPEQQRIATCLSSLDALITAATAALDALKTHKKGLMQQLFPQAEPTP